MPIYDPARSPIDVNAAPARRPAARPVTPPPCAITDPPRALGVFTLEGRLIAATATGNTEVRLDLLGDGGSVQGPLAIVTGAPTAVPLLFSDKEERGWTAEPAVAWYLTRGAVNRYRSTPSTQVNGAPSPTVGPDPHDVSEVRPLGMFSVESRPVVATVIAPGRVRLDLLGAGGVIAAPVGVVTGADTAIPLLFLHNERREWTGEPAVAWYLTRTAIDRYRAPAPGIATTGGPTPARPPRRGDNVEVDADPLVVAAKHCGPDTLVADHHHWFGIAPQRRSRAHPIADPSTANRSPEPPSMPEDAPPHEPGTGDASTEAAR